LFKCDHIILALSGLQLFQFHLQCLTGLFHLLDREMLTILLLSLSNRHLDFIDLVIEHPRLPFRRKRNLLKLRVADNDCIVVTSSDSGAKPLSIGGFKVLFAGDKQLCIGVQTQKLTGPLLGQMVGNHEQTFLTQTQTLGFHCRSRHLKTLASTNFVGKQGVPAIKHMSDCIALMLPKVDFRVHANKVDMGAVILAGAGAVKQLVVLFDQCGTPLRVLPDPARKSILDGLLLLLC